MSITLARLTDSGKARVGVDTLFEWVSPEPLENGAAVTLTVDYAAGTQAYAMASVVAQPRVVVNSIDDRRTLNLDAAMVGAGFGGRMGDCWLMTESQAIPVRVIDGLGTATVRLAEALPTTVDVSVSGVLQRAWFSATLPSADLIAQRDVRYRVTYSAQYGDDLPTMARVDTGLLQIVEQPFSTGLTGTYLGQTFRTLAGTSPRGEQSWDHAIAAGEQELVLWLRSQLKERGLTEDDIPAPQSLRLAHAHLAAAHAIGISDMDTGDRLRERGEALASVALESIWVDSNQDGIVDDGEVEQVTGNRSSDFRASAGVAPASRRFRLGGSH